MSSMSNQQEGPTASFSAQQHNPATEAHTTANLPSTSPAQPGPTEVPVETSKYKIVGRLMTPNEFKQKKQPVNPLPPFQPANPDLFGDALGATLGDGLDDQQTSPPDAILLFYFLGTLVCLYHPDYKGVPYELFVDAGLAVPAADLVRLCRYHKLVAVKADEAGKLFLSAPGAMSAADQRDFAEDLLGWLLTSVASSRARVFDKALSMVIAQGSQVKDDEDDFPRHSTLRRLMYVYRRFSYHTVEGRMPRPLAYRFAAYLLDTALDIMSKGLPLSKYKHIVDFHDAQLLQKDDLRVAGLFGKRIRFTELPIEPTSQELTGEWQDRPMAE